MRGCSELQVPFKETFILTYYRVLALRQDVGIGCGLRPPFHTPARPLRLDLVSGVRRLVRPVWRPPDMLCNDVQEKGDMALRAYVEVLTLEVQDA